MTSRHILIDVGNIVRWRGSFLLSLVFGLPALVVMLYFMFHEPSLTPETTDSNATSLGNTTTPKPRLKESYYQIMVLPGLSVENLLLFLLSTPVQVSAGKCNVWWQYNLADLFNCLTVQYFFSHVLLKL